MPVMYGTELSSFKVKVKWIRNPGFVPYNEQPNYDMVADRDEEVYEKRSKALQEKYQNEKIFRLYKQQFFFILNATVLLIINLILLLSLKISKKVLIGWLKLIFLTFLFYYIDSHLVFRLQRYIIYPYRYFYFFSVFTIAGLILGCLKTFMFVIIYKRVKLSWRKLLLINISLGLLMLWAKI